MLLFTIRIFFMVGMTLVSPPQYAAANIKPQHCASVERFFK